MSSHGRKAVYRPCARCGISRVVRDDRASAKECCVYCRTWLREPLGEWVARAACWGADPESFYADDPSVQKTARKVCMSCQVRQDCLAHALRAGESGIWGGMTAAERRRIKFLSNKTTDNRIASTN